ncbi:hypothetical protein H6G50_22885 [Oscillatoria sp. FACHB-1406]|nr:hypothetical protein [Oscillatoria sp. FACHB-1406]MBD2580511.1 hypothetical protein [Oscillatoria sp. FACHB-1406]
MLPELELLPGAIPEMLVSIADTGRITLMDRYGLMAASLNESLNEEDRRAVNRILRGIVKGRIHIAEF